MTGVHLRAALPLRVQKITADRSLTGEISPVLPGPTLNTRSPTPHLSPLERRDPIAQLTSRIEALESKIDMLLSILLREEQERLRREASTVVVHAQGVEFDSDQPFEHGQVVQVELTLGLYPPATVRCVAEVERSEPSAAGYHVTARFAAISESDVDAIHRFILTTQRQQRRQSATHATVAEDVSP